MPSSSLTMLGVSAGKLLLAVPSEKEVGNKTMKGRFYTPKEQAGDKTRGMRVRADKEGLLESFHCCHC